MDNTEEFRCLSLCSGYAGLELGLRRAVPALRTVCYVEVEAFACANLVSKIEAGDLDAAPIWTDIKTFDGKPFRKRVHIITAGYPCQGESCAGKRQGQADPRWLWPHIERIIETVEPLWFFGENVSGHLTLGFPTVYRSLQLMGYKVEAGLFTAAEVGAPHKRERVYVLARAIGNGRSGLLRQAGQGQDGLQQRKDLNGQGAGDGGERAPRKLANTTKFSKREQNNKTCPNTRKNTRQNTCGRSKQGWPSRPGQPQYEWEEPRVVDDARSAEPKRLSSCQRQEGSEIRKTSERQAQSRLGRAANGTRSRVDRLRLLGNGVVPQQAEKAFRELMKLF